MHPPTLRSGLLLGVTAALYLALIAGTILSERPIRLTGKAIHLSAASLLTILFALVTALAIRKYMVFGYVGQDLAYFAQIMHTTLHGHLFWGNLLQDLLYSHPVSTDFAGHNSPVMFLFLPFYAVFPSPISLLVIRNIVLILCAIPTYKIAHRRVPVASAWLWAAAFLATPAILCQSTFDFYPLTFVALPLLFAVYFYLEQRYTAFCVALLFTLLVREDLSFFALGLGALAFLRHRSPKWYLLPLAAGAIWGAVSFSVVLPAALHGASFVTDACFSHLGTTRAEMIHNVLRHPAQSILAHGNIVYLKTLLTPTALVGSLGSPFSLLSLPFVAINLLAGGGRCITTVIQAQYSIVPAVLLFVGSLLTATNRPRGGLLNSIVHLGLPFPAAAPLLMITLGCVSLIFVTGKPQFDELREHPWDAEARQVIALIPEGASVAAPRYMLPHLANRDCLFQTQRLAEYHTPNFEYLILDTNWSHINAADQYHAPYDRLLHDSMSDSHLEPLYVSQTYEVLWNPAAHSGSCAPVKLPSPQDVEQP